MDGKYEGNVHAAETQEKWTQRGPFTPLGEVQDYPQVKSRTQRPLIGPEHFIHEMKALNIGIKIYKARLKIKRH